MTGYGAAVKPDYQGGGIVNLMASILAGFGAAGTGYVPATALPPEALADSRNIVLLVLDGLGYNYLSGRPDGFLRRHLQARLTSVFPSTTASAIPVFLTGLAPQQHGLTGWFAWFKELGCVAAVLPLKARGSKLTLRENGIEPTPLLAGTPVFDRIDAACTTLAPAFIARSDFNRHYQGRAYNLGYKDLADLCRQLPQALRKVRKRRHYLYAYYAGLDETAHAHGIASPEAAAEFARLDAAVAQLAEALRGSATTLLVTADHGFVDLPAAGFIDLAQCGELADCLALPLCGEPRAAYCYLRPRQEQAFLDYCADAFAPYAACYSSEMLLREHWFGLGEPHPQLAARIGDYTLLLRDCYSIKDWLPGEQRYQHRGVHGGVSSDEMHVPLVVWHSES